MAQCGARATRDSRISLQILVHPECNLPPSNKTVSTNAATPDKNEMGSFKATKSAIIVGSEGERKKGWII